MSFQRDSMQKGLGYSFRRLGNGSYFSYYSNNLENDRVKC